MTRGVLDFVGKRLTQAIEIRSITKVTLAELCGVQPGAITQYEQGKSRPSPEVVQKMADALRLPASFFRKPLPALGTQPTFYRSFSRATETARRKNSRRLEWLLELIRVLERYIHFPEVDFPEVSLPENFRDLTFQQIETAAAQVRRHWNLGEGPLTNVVWLLENKGVVVRHCTLYDDPIDAFSRWCRSEEKQTPVVILGEDKGSGARLRFDAAHELGHLILHRHVGPQMVLLASEHKLIEEQANWFAGAFLLPAKSFEEDLVFTNLNHFVSLKLKWRVSVRAMIMRARQLGLLSPDIASKQYITATKRWGAKAEPLDEKLPLEEPYLIREALLTLITKEVVSREDILAALPLGGAEIARLAGLAEDFFDPCRPEVKIISIGGLGAE